MNNALKIIDVYELEDQDGQFKRLITARNKCKRSFVASFPDGFFDKTYVETHRHNAAVAHRRWIGELNKQKFGALLRQGLYGDIAELALEIESEADLLTPAERNALSKVIDTADGARMFAHGLYEYLYSDHVNTSDQAKFEHFTLMLQSLPQAVGVSRQVQNSIIVSWPIATAFGAIAQPRRGIFVKPIVARQAAMKYGFPFAYQAEPSWAAYSSMLDFAACLRADLSDLRPRDLIDIGLFIKTLGAA